MISLTDRIGGGWPQPEYETCDWCDAPTPTVIDQHLRIIGNSLAASGGQATLEEWA